MAIVSSKPGEISRSMLIRNAGVVTMDSEIGDLERADIKIEDGLISTIESKIDAPGIPVIDADNMIAIPGFVDGHRHMWEGVLRASLPSEDLSGYFRMVNGTFGPAYDPEDAYIGTLVSALGALDAGITTVLDWSHIQNSPDHSLACIAALRESGLRSIFAYGPGDKTSSEWPHGLTRLQKEEFSGRDDLVTLALAGVSPEHAPDELVKSLFALAREAGVITTLHCGLEGRGKRGEIGRIGREGLLGPDVNLVHCNTLDPSEWAMIAETGTSVCITPTIEMQMGHGVPPMQPALDAGVRPALGVDVETSAPGDIFTQMRAALGLQRMNAFARRRAGEEEVRTLGVRDVLEFATVAGAVSVGMGNRIGVLAPGRQADIVLLRADLVNAAPINDMPSSIVLGMDARNVDTVIVAGKIVKRAGTLVGVDTVELMSRLYAARDRIFRKSKVGVVSPSHRWRCGCIR